MLDRLALKAEIVRNGYRQNTIAELLGMSEKTFISRMKKGNFGIDEAEKLIKVLHINNPGEIFFAKDVT